MAIVGNLPALRLPELELLLYLQLSALRHDQRDKVCGEAKVKGKIEAKAQRGKSRRPVVLSADA